MIKKGNAYSALLQSNLNRYQSPDNIPPFHREHLDQLAYLNHQMFKQAEALGWREESQHERNHYLQSVEKYSNQISQKE
jgi:hypothetical protein